MNISKQQYVICIYIYINNYKYIYNMYIYMISLISIIYIVYDMTKNTTKSFLPIHPHNHPVPKSVPRRFKTAWSRDLKDKMNFGTKISIISCSKSSHRFFFSFLLNAVHHHHHPPPPPSSLIIINTYQHYFHDHHSHITTIVVSFPTSPQQHRPLEGPNVVDAMYQKSARRDANLKGCCGHDLWSMFGIHSGELTYGNKKSNFRMFKKEQHYQMMHTPVPCWFTRAYHLLYFVTLFVLCLKCVIL